MSKTTPMMTQYQAIKAEHRDAILLFRLGDFYEMFGQDAVEASKILGITLTARNKKSDPIPMCGVPYHSVENYIAKLSKAGKKVAICDQVSDPSLPGIVKRKVVRVITPGTSYNEQLLDQKANRYIAALFPQKDYYGLACADLTTGEFFAFEFQGESDLRMELTKLMPAELVLQREHYDNPDLRVRIGQITDSVLSPCDFYDESASFLKRHFKVTTLDGFGIGSQPFAVQAAAFLLHYLLDTQKEELKHIERIRSYHREDWMRLDESTIRNLELFSTLRDQEQKGTLLSILDETTTSMGGRLLRRWVLQPLLKPSAIEARHLAVEELIQADEQRHKILALLKEVSDVERLLGRLSSGTGNARDLLALGHSIRQVPELQERLKGSKSRLLLSLAKDLKPLENLSSRIQRAILDEPAVKLTEGGMIREDYSPKLDELHKLMKEAKSALKAIEEEEVKATGINSLKVRFNKVFGYYIEVSNANLDKVPKHYVRKQTLANAERFLTPELKEYEEKVLTAEEKSKQLEYELFLELRERVLDHIFDLKKNAQLIAELDALLSFAQVAIKRDYCRPQMAKEKFCLDIVDGRHPVVESMNFQQAFTPNDAQFIRDEQELALITGPNMSGKSTYLRQIALIALMNQIGSFVPAKAATLPVFDQIFTRVGASDNLVRGQSTFMVEMQESAYILNHATERSLVILDEVGRGTSTYDGLSLAWSIFEFLHHELRSFTLFASHYHELITLAEQLKRARNLSIDVEETARGVLFLHKIKQGGIDQSYGIEVAKLAGLPHTVLDRARGILKSLEAKQVSAGQKSENQMDLFTHQYAPAREPSKLTHPALERLKALDPNTMTPMEALGVLDELKQLKER